MRALLSLSPLCRDVLFSAVGTLLVLGGMLLPGYLLFLDWSAGPHSTFAYHDISSFMSAPSSVLVYALEQVMPAWVVQKTVLFGVVFVLFFFPLRFYPWKVDAYLPYLASLVSVFNPFVYERLISGQWRVVLGYAFLFPLLYYLVHFARSASYKTASKVALTLVFTGMWSIHFYAIGAVVVAIFSVLLLAKRVKEGAYQVLRKTVQALALFGVLVALSALYWVVPTLLYNDATLDTFDSVHFDAFSTVRDPQLGALGSVLTLRGFWLERHAWARDYILPPSPNPYVFYATFAVLLALSFVGWLTLLRKESEVFTGGALAVVFLLATVFAVGVSGYGVWYVTVWLLENSPLWSGFRDTHKWAGVLASSYALFFPLGVAYAVARFARFKYAIVFVGALVPLCIVPQMLFGLHGQVKTVWYPTAWVEAGEVVQSAPECTLLVLPWHMYYAVSWNDDRLSSNPAGKAFNCTALTSRDPGIGAVGNAPNTTDVQSLLGSTVANNRMVPEDAVAVFRSLGVTHILYTDDIEETDIFTYPFLEAESLVSLYEKDGVYLYQIAE